MKYINELFFDLIKKFPLPFISLVGFVIIQIILNTLSIISIAPIIDFLTSSEKYGFENNKSNNFLEFYYYLFDNNNLELIHLISIFGLLIFFVAILATIIRFVILKIQYLVLTHLQVDSLKIFFDSNYSFFNLTSHGVLLNSFNKEITKIGVAFSQFALIIANSLQILIIILIPISISVYLTGYFVLISIIIVIPVFFIRNLIYSLGKKNVETSNKATEILQEALTSAKLVYSFNNQKNVTNNFYFAFKDHANVSIALQTLSSAIMLILTPLGLIAALLVLNKGYVDNFPLTDLAIIIFTFSRIVPIIAQIFQSKTNIEGMTAAYEQLKELTKIANNYKEEKKTIKVDTFNECIEFKNVSFNYKNRKNTIKDLSFRFIKNNTTLLLGKSGSGKTTIVDLILGLYKPDKGKIFFDNHSYNEIDFHSIRSFIGYVPQDPQLFNTSIKNNLLWANTLADEKKIWDTLKLANADEFVAKLPDKLNTIIGDRGSKLSGGQKQRIALTRALIKNPSILILDEATSFLDKDSEQLIFNSISKLRKSITIIIITHKVTNEIQSDFVYVINNGIISEKGSLSLLKENKNSFVYKLIESK